MFGIAEAERHDFLPRNVDWYLQQKPKDEINLRPDVGTVLHVRSHGVHVVQCDEQDFAWLQTK